MPTNPRPHCPFCVENGRVKVLQKNEEAFLVAALDSEGRLMPGCYLIIPLQHVESVTQLPDTWHAHLADLLQCIPEYGPDVCFNVSYNQGKAAGQRVPHVHAWVVFRNGEEGTQAYELGLKTLIDRCKSLPSQ